MNKENNPARSSGSFRPEEFIPVTGHARPDRSSSTRQRVAKVIAAYKLIRIENDLHTELHDYLDMVTAVGLEMEGLPRLGGRALALSGTGKTTTAETFRDAYEARALHTPGERPIVIVPLDKACTSRRLFVAILRVLGDPSAEKGTEDVLKARTIMTLKRLRVRLLVIDEIQHLTERNSEHNDICDVLKRFLDDAVVPLVLLGTDKAAPTLNANPEFANRMLAPCDLAPLRRSKPADRRLFRRYVNALDDALVGRGLANAKSNLAEKRIMSCLIEVSGGAIGRVSNLVREALMIATKRNADRIELCDLSAATSSWAIAQGFIKYDPFRLGVREPKDSK